ncbi:HDIG domain-containing protein [Lachnospiraceae bacterium XBB1006]|nr:HDIG domain-containing protein [Lachnospiraceae bacterium XBB1006]
MSMDYVNRLIQNETYLQTMKEIHEMEKNRIFCHHGFNHLLDVARISYIMNLEYGFGFEKEFLYLCALLHDIGRAQEYMTGVSHAKAGVTLARQLLTEIGYPKEKQEVILAKVADHRHAPLPKEGVNRDNFFWFADKRARNCFACNVAEQCNWKLEKRTLQIEW